MFNLSATPQGKSACALVLLAALAAGLAMGAPQQAHAGGVSPFTGCYVDGYITISNGGRISGSWPGVRLSGRIWDDGYMELTVKVASISFDLPTRGGGKSGTPSTYTAIGIGALDEDGNLYGVLMWDGDAVSPWDSEFFWARCN